MRRQIAKPLETAIARLPDTFRPVFVLREIEGLSVEDTAEALQIPEETVRTRLFRATSTLSPSSKDEKPETIVPKISQETLAEMVGTTRSRISYFLNKFRRLGLVEYNGHMTVNRALLNVVLYD